MLLVATYTKGVLNSGSGPNGMLLVATYPKGVLNSGSELIKAHPIIDDALVCVTGSGQRLIYLLNANRSSAFWRCSPQCGNGALCNIRCLCHRIL